MKFGLKIAAAACLAMAPLLTTTASAVTYNLGVVDPVTPVGLGGVLNSANASDTLIFALSGASDLGGGLTMVPPVVLGPGLVFGLSNVQASFYAGAVGSGTLLGSIGNGQSTSFGALAAGDYYVVVTGTAINPTLGGTYAIGLMTANAAPAPGPAGLAVALAGGACLFWKRRRNKAADGNSANRALTA